MKNDKIARLEREKRELQKRVYKLETEVARLESILDTMREGVQRVLKIGTRGRR